MESETLSSRQTKPKLFCFVLMPFAPEFDDVYQIGIKEACQAAGAYCERVDEQIYAEKMLDRIYNQIAKADLIIADMTGKNANVFYEVGYAHALGKPTVLLTRNAADIPFDLTQFPHIVYESKLTVLREKLTKRVAWQIENPSTSLEDTSFPLMLYVNRKNPDLETINLNLEKVNGGWTQAFETTIENNGTSSFSSDDFKLGVIAQTAFYSISYDNSGESVDGAMLANGATQYIIPRQRGLMPGESQKISLTIYFHVNNKPNDLELVTLRLFTKIGFRDHVVYLRNS